MEFDRDEVSKQVTERIRTMDFKAFEVKVTTCDPAKIDVEAISAEAQAEPKNATVDKTDGKTILPSVDGVEIDLEEAKAIVGEGREQTYKIPVKRTPAEITADQAGRCAVQRHAGKHIHEPEFGQPAAYQQRPAGLRAHQWHDPEPGRRVLVQWRCG